MFFVLFLVFINSASGCGPGFGSEKTYFVSLRNIKSPLNFVYSQYSTTSGLPVSQSESTAKQNIESFTQEIVIDELKNFISSKLHIPVYLVENTIEEFQISLAPNFKPQGCAFFLSGVFLGATTVASKTNNKDDGDWCLFDGNNNIISICLNQTGTVSTCPTNAIQKRDEYQFMVNPGNGILAYQTRSFWNDFLSEVLLRLKNSRYGTAFEESTISLQNSING